MVRKYSICGNDFESRTRAKTCSEECHKQMDRDRSNKWASENRDRVREMNRVTRQGRKENGKQLSYQRERRNTPDGYVDRFMERIRLKTPDSDITRDFLTGLISTEKCCITGVGFSYTNKYNSYHDPLAPSIDRIDSERGYYLDNVQILLSCINKFKNDLPNEDFLKLWKALTSKEK